MTALPGRRTKRRYAHELYPGPKDEWEIRPLTVEVPHRYARFLGLSSWGTGWFDAEAAVSMARTVDYCNAAEIALLLASDLTDPSCDASAVAAATASAVAAIEIVDSRIADWKITFADTVADNGSSAFYVLGSDPKPLDGLDLYTCGMALEVNGVLASLGAGAACLGHPLEAAAWLARTLAAAGDPLRAGEVILTGALGPMVAISRGDRVEARIGGLGSVSFTYGS